MKLLVHFYRPKTWVGRVARYLTLSDYVHCITQVDEILLDISIFKKSRWYPSKVLDHPSNKPDLTIDISNKDQVSTADLDSFRLTNRSFSFNTTCITLSQDLIYNLTGTKYKGRSIRAYLRSIRSTPLASACSDSN